MITDHTSGPELIPLPAACRCGMVEIGEAFAGENGAGVQDEKKFGVLGAVAVRNMFEGLAHIGCPARSAMRVAGYEMHHPGLHELARKLAGALSEASEKRLRCHLQASAVSHPLADLVKTFL